MGPLQPVDEIAARLARAQRGAVGRAQLLRRGVSGSAIDRRVRSGQWQRAAPAVYVLASHPGTWERQLWVALLAHPDAALGLATAAVVHRMAGFQRGPIHLVAGARTNPRSSVATVHRFDGALTARVGGMLVTTPAQTVADLCSTIWTPRLDGALDQLVLQRRVTIDELRERAQFYRSARRKGAELFAALVEERSDAAWQPSESVLEAELRAMLRVVPGRPRTVWQPALPWRSATGERLDALLPDDGILVEADGRAWHARVGDFDRDRWRDNEAIAHGLLPMRFTWVHLTRRREASARLVGTAITRRATAVQPASEADARCTIVDSNAATGRP